jgi:hypothetical protein
MVSSGMLRCVTLVRIDVSEELSASFIRVTRIGEHLVFLRRVRRLLVTVSVALSSQILVTLMKEALISSETSVLTRATRRNIPENTILHDSCSSQNTLTSILLSPAVTILMLRQAFGVEQANHCLFLTTIFLAVTRFIPVSSTVRVNLLFHSQRNRWSVTMETSASVQADLECPTQKCETAV